MKIELWTDILCEYCFLGKRYFELALEQLPELKDVEVIYRSYELVASDYTYNGESIKDIHINEHNMTEDTVEVHMKGMSENGRKVGLTYNFNDMKMTSTMDAHRLIKHAKTYGKEKAMLDRIFLAYFTEGKLISDKDILVSLGVEIGFDETDIRTMLTDTNRYVAEIREDEDVANGNNLDYIPYFRVNDSYIFSGVLTINDIVEHLKKVI